MNAGRARCAILELVLGFLLLAWLANVVSLAVADLIFDGIAIDGLWSLVLAGGVFGVANTLVKPLLTLIALPFIALTLGLAMIAVNAAMLALAEWIAPEFSIDGFWTYIGATFVVGIVNALLHALFRRRRSARPAVA